MCWWWTVIKAHELSPEYTPFSVLLTNCYRRFPAKQSTILTDSSSINHSTGVTGMLQPVRSVTFRAQSVIEVWPSRPNKLQKYDLVGPVSYRSVTLWAQSVTEVWPCGPNRPQKYDFQGQVSYRSMTLWAKSATEVWPSGPSPLQNYDLHYGLQYPISFVYMTFRTQSAVSASVVCLLWKSSRNVYRHCQHHRCKMSEGRRFIPPALTSGVCIVAWCMTYF